MSCEKYQEVLIDLAASGAEPVGVVRSHLDGCAPCRTYLKEQQTLLAAVDSGVRQTVNAPVPASVLQRFGARLAQQTAPRHSQSARWKYAGAALAAAAMLVLFLLPNLRSPSSKQRSPVASSAQHAIADEKADSTAPLETATRPVQQPGKRSRTPAPNPDTEILVPPDERIAFERFLSDLNRREDLAVALVKPLHEQREQRVVSLETPNIEIAALTVQPITENTDR